MLGYCYFMFPSSVALTCTFLPLLLLSPILPTPLSIRQLSSLLSGIFYSFLAMILLNLDFVSFSHTNTHILHFCNNIIAGYFAACHCLCTSVSNFDLVQIHLRRNLELAARSSRRASRTRSRKSSPTLTRRFRLRSRPKMSRTIT